MGSIVVMVFLISKQGWSFLTNTMNYLQCRLRHVYFQNHISYIIGEEDAEKPTQILGDTWDPKEKEGKKDCKSQKDQDHH